MTIKHVQKGEAFVPIAERTNAFVDAANDFRSRKHEIGAQGDIGTPDDFTPIWIENKTGAAVPRWGVIKVGEPVVLPTDDQEQFEESILFEGNTPTDSGLHVITAQNLSENEVGIAILLGIARVQINVTDVAHGRAKPIASDSTKMASSATGPYRILWKESGLGDKEAKVIREQDICEILHNLTIDTLTDGNNDYFMAFKNDGSGNFTCVRVLAENCP
jgi:hypothetical protein